MNQKASLKKLSIKHHLIGLVLITVIPVVFFAAGLVTYLAHQRSEALESNLLGTTKALTAAVDEQIVSVISSLKILSEVEDFHPDSIQYLHKRLSEFVKNQKDWSYISFVDPSGVQIFNTSKAFGSKLPRLKSDSSFQQMLKTRELVISGYRKDQDVVTIMVPVKKNGLIIYALVGSLKVSSFSKLLASQDLPDKWIAAIMDKDANILAYSTKAQNYVGKKAKAEFSEKTHRVDSYTFNDTSAKGKKAFGASSHSKITGWTIVLRIPDDGNLFTYWKSILFIIIGGSLLLCLSILIAIYLGRKISAPILGLAKSAKDLGQGRPLQEINTSLKEAIDVNAALILAAIERGDNEQKIQQLYSKAQEAIKLRDTFLSVASHELKTPITTLQLQFQMIDRMIRKKDLIPRQELEKPFIRMLGQLKRLTLLIDDLLDVTRINSGKMEYRPERFDLVPFVQDIVQQLEGEALKVGSTISISGSEEIVGTWDKHRLEQVIVNLITNAIKYGNSRPISIKVLEHDGSALIEVHDRGLGIPADQITKIFERFERVGDTKHISGLGLGLWIVKKILEGLGGSIEVASQVGVGSVFTVRIPVVKQEEISAKTLLQLNLTSQEELRSSL